MVTCEDLHVLTMAEIFTVIPKQKIPWSDRRTKEMLCEAVLLRSQSEIQALVDLAEAKMDGNREKASKKRKHIEEVFQQRSFRRVLDDIEDYSTDPKKFMEVPTKVEVQQCHRAFLQMTCNAAMSQKVCVACARRVWAEDGQEHQLGEIPNRHWLAPQHEHVAHRLYEGMLLVGEYLRRDGSQTYGFLCQSCSSSLMKNRLPPLSLANQMWIGNVPFVLKVLTIPEQLLIALQYPRCFVFKLFPKDGRGQDPNTLQRGMAGNVTTYEMNTAQASEMLQGNLLPRRPHILASVIAVAFIGHGKVPKNWLKNTFRVRRHMVLNAILWLRENNSLYQHIILSSEQVDSLPLDDVPEEIMASFRNEDNPALVAQERASYIPSPGDETDDESHTG
jgi:Domain of unknown function (DUF6570)